MPSTEVGSSGASALAAERRSFLLMLVMGLVMALTTAVFVLVPVEWAPVALVPSFVVGGVPWHEPQC